MSNNSSKNKYDETKDGNIWAALVISFILNIKSVLISFSTKTFQPSLIPGLVLAGVWIAWIKHKKGAKWSLLEGFLLGLLFAALSMFFIAAPLEQRMVNKQIKKSMEGYDIQKQLEALQNSNEYSLNNFSKEDFKKRKEIESDLINLKTKEEIINYIKNDEEYIDTTCFIENVSALGMKIDFVNVPEVKGYLKDSNKTLFCEINEKFNDDFIKNFWNAEIVSYLENKLKKISEKESNYFYDCLFLYKNHTSHQVCFEDETIKALNSTLNNNWKLDIENINVDYAFDNDKIYIQSLCESKDKSYYSTCTNEID